LYHWLFDKLHVCGRREAACLEALELNTPGYMAFHIIGAAAARKHFDLERTEIELGFVPRIRFEQYPY